MTPALSAADARHLSIVQGPRILPAQTRGRPGTRESAPAEPAAPAPPLVGYVVLVPEGTDPAELLATQGLYAEVRPLLPPGGITAGGTGGGTGAGDGAVSEPGGGARRAGSAAAPVPYADSAPHAPPGSIRTDTARHTAEVDGRPLELTYLEFELLAHFVANPHRVHTRDHLVATLWGYSHIGDGRTVDVHIARLRRKLGPTHRDAIVTVRRVGYKYVPGAVS